MDQIILMDTQVDEPLTYDILYEILLMDTPSIHIELFPGLQVDQENWFLFTNEEGERQREEMSAEVTQWVSNSNGPST